jgi:hypothetical protein
VAADDPVSLQPVLDRPDELGGEPLDLPVDSDVIDGDSALGQQLLDVR